MIRIPTLALAALLGASLSASAGARQAKAQETKTPDPATVRALMSATENEPDPTVLKAMKSQVFVIKHREAGQLADLLRPLASGIKGARMSSMSSTSAHGFNAVTVRDFPENLAAIGAAIQRLDVPASVEQSQDVDLQIQVLFASRQATPEADLPKDLEPVLKSLRATLGYRGYTLAASLSQRVRVNGDRDSKGRAQIEGSALGLGTPKEPHALLLDWEVNRGISMQAPASGPATFAMQRFQVSLRDLAAQLSVASLETGLTLKEGEHVVVGTSTIKDHGFIVVVSARRVQ